MPAPQFITAAFALAAVAAWGASDFIGGYATRRADAFLFTAAVNFGGLLFLLILTTSTHTSFPVGHGALWALVGGMSGGAALGIFYRALSSGSMGLMAPVAAVLSAGIPVLLSVFTEGLPGRISLVGFVFAAAGLWLITRTEQGSRPEGIGLAILAGFGFAGFYLCIHRAGAGAPFGIAAVSRTGGLIVAAAIVLFRRRFRDITALGLCWAVLAGCVDSAGSLFFIRASQTGRLDEAVVISSLYPAVTVLLARIFLKEHFTRWRFLGLLAALAAVPMIAAG
jgi:drug/metabolite transporter (DMT)-like permease